VNTILSARSMGGEPSSVYLLCLSGSRGYETLGTERLISKVIHIRIGECSGYLDAPREIRGMGGYGMSGSGGSADLGWTRAGCALVTPMYGPAARCKRLLVDAG